jgi:hypothetical protein
MELESTQCGRSDPQFRAALPWSLSSPCQEENTVSEARPDRFLDKQPSLQSYFSQALEETLVQQGGQLDPIVKAYLLGLLEDAACDQEVIGRTVSSPLALQLDAALRAEPAQRFDKLRQLGDGVLVVGGMFRERLESQGLADRYVAEVGSRAYLGAHAVLNTAALSAPTAAGDTGPGILEGLALAFHDLMALLREVGSHMAATAAHARGDVSRLLELWLNRKSRAAHHLLISHGLAISPDWSMGSGSVAARNRVLS